MRIVVPAEPVSNRPAIRPTARICLPEAAPICRACGRPDCDHPDPVFVGVVPLLPTRLDTASGIANDIRSDHIPELAHGTR